MHRAGIATRLISPTKEPSVYRRLTLGRWTVNLRTGAHRHAHAETAAGVTIDQRAAELAARLTAGLNTRVLLTRRGYGTALFLLDVDGEPLCTAHNPQDGPIWPIPVAVVPDDPRELIAVHREPVPGTTVGMVGNRGDSLDDAAAHLIDHYGPAVHRDVGAGEL
jgi:hypothetical protein